MWWAEKIAPKDIRVDFLEPMNIALRDKRCDKDKALERKCLFCMIWGNPTCNHMYPYEREAERIWGQTHTEEERLM